MSNPGLLVIGGGPAGIGAATAFREHNSEAPVMVLTADPALPYERPPLSKEFLRGEAEDTDARLHDPSWFIDQGIGIQVGDGETIECDLALAATGVTPQSAQAEAAGVATEDGRILVDSGMRTSVEDVFAAGDVAWAENGAAGRRVAVEHWQDADDQGAIAGANAAGQAQLWSAVPGFWTTIGDATVKYHAWGDGFDRVQVRDHSGGFTVWYEAGGVVVGVLTHNADEDYDRGEGLIAERRPVPAD